MIEGDKVDSLAKELFSLIEAKKYKKILLNLYNAGYMSSAMLAQLVRLHRKMQDVKGQGQALLPASTGHGRVQGQSVRSVVRDLPRRADSPEEVLMRRAGKLERTGSTSSGAHPARDDAPRVLVVGLATFFVVLGVGVDLPGVEPAQAQDVPRGQQRGHHRVILVVVLVHAVAAGQLEVGQVGQPAADHGQVGLVLVVVDRVGLGHADDAAVDHLGGGDQADRVDLAPAELEQIGVGLVQRSSPSKQKYSRPRLLETGRAPGRATSS